MQQGSRLKPAMARAESWFAVFGRNGVMPGQPRSGQTEEGGRYMVAKTVDGIRIKM